MASLNPNALFYLLIPAWFLATALTVSAQEPGSAYPPPPVDIGDTSPPTGPALTGPTMPGVPADPPAWTFQHGTTNHPGTVGNTHQQWTSEDGAQQLRQHIVANPRGEMTQTWEESYTQDGYLRQRTHTFNDPDDTLRRQHQWSRFGTDANNYTRQHEMQLRDGRTILHSQTRSWDGNTGTMQRTFQGPNGQTRQIERPWAPEGGMVLEPGATVVEPAPAELSTLPPPPGNGAGSAAPPETQPGQRKAWGWLEKLNPFRRNRRPEGAEPGWNASPRASGFTLGAGGWGRMGQGPPGLMKQQPGQPSPNSHRPAWAGHPSPPQPTTPPGMAHGRNR